MSSQAGSAHTRALLPVKMWHNNDGLWMTKFNVCVDADHNDTKHLLAIKKIAYIENNKL